jgi:hypothetical protein
MPNLSRIGDLVVGTCCCHKSCIGSAGIIVGGAFNTSSEFSSNSRVVDPVITFCGHASVVISGFDQINIESSPTAHIGSCVVGCLVGVVVSGASTVYF